MAKVAPSLEADCIRDTEDMETSGAPLADLTDQSDNIEDEGGKEIEHDNLFVLMYGHNKQPNMRVKDRCHNLMRSCARRPPNELLTYYIITNAIRYRIVAFSTKLLSLLTLVDFILPRDPLSVDPCFSTLTRSDCDCHTTQSS